MLETEWSHFKLDKIAVLETEFVMKVLIGSLSGGWGGSCSSICSGLIFLFFVYFQELETQRLQNRQAVHDRMLAVARAKESLRQDMQVDMEKVRSKMKEVSHNTLLNLLFGLDILFE